MDDDGIRIGGLGLRFPPSCRLRRSYIRDSLQSIIVGCDLELHQTFPSGCYAASPCLLNQKTHSSRLVQCSQLALMTLASDIAEHSMSLYEDLPDVRHQSSSVSQGVALADPSSHDLIVGFILVDCPQIAWAEHFGLRLDHQVLVRDYPFFLDQGQLLHYLSRGVVNKGGGPWAVDCDDCVDLVSECLSHKVAGVSPPDGEDAAYCEVSIDDRAAIQWIIGDRKPFSFSDLLIVRSFLTGEGLDQSIPLEMLLNNLIALDILMQLLIPKQIGGLHHNHWRMPQKFSDLPRRIQQREDNRSLFSLQLWFEILHDVLYGMYGNIMNLTMQERSIADRYRKELKTQDFLLLTQENKEYKQLVKILQEKEGILTGKIAELEKSLMRMENEKDEYKAMCQEYTIKFNHYQGIKSELLQEYRVLKSQIEMRFEEIATKDVEIAELRRVNEGNLEGFMRLEQNAKRDQLVIEELRQHVSKLQKELIQQKIATFSHLVDHRPPQHPKKENQISRSNAKPSPSISFKSSTINATSIRSSNNSSISFSLLSTEPQPQPKSSISRKHNKSIYI